MLAAVTILESGAQSHSVATWQRGSQEGADGMLRTEHTPGGDARGQWISCCLCCCEALKAERSKFDVHDWPAPQGLVTWSVRVNEVPNPLLRYRLNGFSTCNGQFLSHTTYSTVYIAV